jgi:hypothetical protein
MKINNLPLVASCDVGSVLAYVTGIASPIFGAVGTKMTEIAVQLCSKGYLITCKSSLGSHSVMCDAFSITEYSPPYNYTQ